MLKLVFKNGTEIELAEFNTGSFIVLCQNTADFSDVLAQFTEENLESLQITNDGAIIQSLSYVAFMGAQAIVNSNGSITGHYYYRGEYTEHEMVTAARILLGEEV